MSCMSIGYVSTYIHIEQWYVITHKNPNFISGLRKPPLNFSLWTRKYILHGYRDVIT